MARSYRHIKEYEREIMQLKEKRYTQREIGEQLGFSKDQIHNFFSRHNKTQRKIASGIIPKKRGRPVKMGKELPPSVQHLGKLTQLQYELASKEKYIKRLEMENELMRDFLSLTERK